MASSQDNSPAQDIGAAKETYAGFIRLIKVSTPVIAVITAFVIFLLTR